MKMELNRRLQRVVEVLPTGPASPIWDLDGTDSPIASEACPMSSMSDLVSAESNIGCSSPGLSSSSLLPDPCLGGIGDLGDGLHGDGGLFDTAQVSCSFSVPPDNSVTSLDSMSTGLDPCDDSNDTLKHSGVSYNLSECNTDILDCVKDTCDKTPASLVFSDQSSLAVGEDFAKIDDGSVVDDLHESSCLGLSSDGTSQQLPSTCDSIPVAISATSSANLTGFNLPMLLSSPSGQPVATSVAEGLTVINLNIPLVASSCAQSSNTTNNCSLIRVGQQNLAFTNLVLLQGPTPGAPVASTSFTVPSCNLVTALPCLRQTTSSFAGQYVHESPGQSGVRVTDQPMSSDTSEELTNAVSLPVILSPVSTVPPAFRLVSSVSESNKTGSTVHSPISSPYENSFESSSSVNEQSIEMDTNRFLNLETDCLPGSSPTVSEDKSTVANTNTTEGQTCDTGVTAKGISPPPASSADFLTVRTQEGGTNKGPELSENQVCPQDKTSIKTDAELRPAETSGELPGEALSPQVPHGPSATSLSVTSLVQLIPAKKPPHIFRCDLCSATFNRLGNYSRHRMIHTVHVKDDYRYKCEHCERMFLQKCDLKRHQLIHTKEEPYKCSVCSKGYIRQSDLRVHMRFHNREKVFKCSYCPKNFYQSGDLNRHVRSVHLQTKMLTCGHCDQPYGYAKEATLIRHMQTKHKDIIRQSLKQKLGASMDSDNTESAKETGKKEAVEVSSAVQVPSRSAAVVPIPAGGNTQESLRPMVPVQNGLGTNAHCNTQQTALGNDSSECPVGDGDSQATHQNLHPPATIATHEKMKIS
ncbi:zinc finger protein 236-like [Liolophura sinensis]|uniref:zinc finger protein 236-like n=1 Tax=Liolophura sinensis TaxID=3198878 RepID=UPI00315911E2